MAYHGYSAKVVLQLVVGGETLSLSHVGPSGLVVRDECLPMGPDMATLRIKVDDNERVREVYLPRGIPGPDQRFEFF